MKQSLTIACLLGLGLPGLVRAQVYEDEDLLTNKKRKSIETKQAQVSQADEPDMTVRAPLVVPVIDPSLDVTLFLSNGQELPAREGSLDVPAGFLNVQASRTQPSGKVDTLEYAVDVPADGTYLPLPRILDLYVGGVHRHTWFQSHQNSDPPTDIRILLPNRMNALPATAEGLLLPEGETVRIDLPNEHPAFQAHSQWSKEMSVLGSYHLLTLTGVVGGIVLAAVGSTWMKAASEDKRTAESIDDPSLDDEYESLNNQFKKSQATGWAFVGAGAAVLVPVSPSHLVPLRRK